MLSTSSHIGRLTLVHDHVSPRLLRPLLPSYTLRGMAGEDDIADWVAIWREAHPELAVDSARFHRAFGTDPLLIHKRCLLLADSDGRAVGVGAAWFDPDFQGACVGRLHWLALRPSHQGIGLGGVLLAAILELLTQLHSRSYLITQSDRLDAIRIYLKHGFTPIIATAEEQQHWHDITRILALPPPRLS